ncbi:MAG TPA: RraA family protein [bacterium]|nr:RraA family protein [bacterium]
MPQPLGPDTLARLRTYTTPTLSNAIETFNVRPKNTGFTRGRVRCLFPDLGPMVGYAVTATCRAATVPSQDATARRATLWRAIEGVPAPRIVVIQDLDDPPGIGAFWGEVQSTIHHALGCVGTVTNGGVRDLNEVRALGFHFFAGSVAVSRAYVHLVEVGTPVEIDGLAVGSGDLLHADQHGVLAIPHEIAGQLDDAVERVNRSEQEILEYCRGSDFTRDGLEAIYLRRR